MRRYLILPTTLFLGACGVSSSEHRAVVAERDSLHTVLASAMVELEDLKFGSERLLALATTSFADGKLEDARDHAAMLVDRHPGAAERTEADRIRAAAEARITERAERARREREAAAERERRERELAERRAREERERALAAARRKRDDMRGITWYTHRSSPEYLNSRSDIHLYVGKTDGGSANPRFRIQYKADSWLFIRSYLIKADNHTFTLAPGTFEIERDNGYGGIWEWYDIPATPREFEILRAIATSKSAVIRHQGQQYHRDRTITDREKQAIREMLIVHDNLKSM
jgi:flagellar biosynthesis GTPase FlhF